MEKMLRVLLLFTVCSIASAAEETGYGCFEKIRLPEYPPLSRQAVQTGSVSAEITFNADTRQLQIDVTGRAPDLLKEYIKMVLSEAQLRKECFSSRVVLTVRFELVGEHSDRPYLETLLVWPDTIIVRARPHIIDESR